MFNGYNEIAFNRIAFNGFDFNQFKVYLKNSLNSVSSFLLKLFGEKRLL